MEYLERSIKASDGGGSFLERTGLLARNVLFCTRRSGGDHSYLHVDSNSSIDGDGLIMESLVKDDDGENGTGPRVAVRDVGKGTVARKFGLTHFIDDRAECLLSDLFEGFLYQKSESELDGVLIQFGEDARERVPDGTEVVNFLVNHKIPIAEEKREQAVHDALAKWIITKGWDDVLQAFGIRTSAPVGNAYPGKRLTPKIPLGWDNLSADQKRVYEDLVRLINQPPAIVDEQYNAIPDSFGGRVVGTDAARELSSEYRSGWEGALLYSQVTSSPASAYAQDRFRREIEKAPSDSDRRRVLVLTAGGPASGKTSVVRSDMVNGTVDLVMDQNLGKHDRAIEQIELALVNGWDVRVVYVFKPFDLVAAKVFDRANKHGRWALASVVGKSHISAQNSVIKLYDLYSGSCVQIKVMENLHSKDNPVPCVEISVDDVRPGGKYHIANKEELIEETIKDALQAAKESGKIEPRLMAAMEFGTNPATGR
mmetsp:Transcript_25570/g.47015  ORF Transcript_25570/g.47015 Transcript_25570/m.47015 type:complete len:483 (-) Transcript_25570:35-1483(-)